MTRHSDSPAFIAYLQNIIADLIPPLEDTLWKRWEADDDIPDGLESINLDFWVTAQCFMNIDGNVSSAEAAFMEDISVFTGGEESELNDDELREHYQNFIDENSNYENLRVPYVVYYLQEYDEENGTDYATTAKTMYFRYANTIVKSDGTVSEAEKIALSNYKELLFNNPEEEKEEAYDEVYEEVESSEDMTSKIPFKDKSSGGAKNPDELLSELSSKIGLDKVKNDVSQLVNFLKVQKMREEIGMSVPPVSRHLVFLGNPGTGKTTIARLVAEIYKSLGILSKGHIVETDRAGLVGHYLGETAQKVKGVVKQALGGVLFIDEAYSLTPETNWHDYGSEAVDTLIKLMEDNRNDLIVIAAGYTDKMNKFLDSNPGLRSRFNKKIEFEDYAPGQLLQIFESFCNQNKYCLDSSASYSLLKLFSFSYENRDEKFGNGRYARNLYEMTINNQANRIVSLPRVDKNILATIEAIDIPKIADLQNIL